MTMLGDAIDTLKKTFTLNDMASMDDLKKLYERNLPSFTSLLPYSGYDEETNTFLLEDEISRAVCLTIEPIATEGRSAEYLTRMRDVLEDIYSVFDEKMLDQGQWVIQEYSYDDTDVDTFMENMENYIMPHAKGTHFSKTYLDLMRSHLSGIQLEGGLFRDTEVTGENWQLRIPRTKLIIYRRLSSSDIRQVNKGKYDPARELNQIVASIDLKIKAANFRAHRDSMESVFKWLFKTFNPNPNIHGMKNKSDYYNQMTDIDGDVLSGRDFCEALFTESPESSVEDNCWYFNKTPSRFLRMGGLRTKPRIGQMSGEVMTGSGNSGVTRCLLDSMPAGTVITKTVVITTQSEFEMRFAKVGKNSNGQNAESERMKHNLKQVRSNGVGEKKKVLCSIGVFVSGKDLVDLEDNQRKVMTVFNNNSITLFDDATDKLGLNAYIMHLPMNFRPELDKKHYYQRSMWAQHAANLSLFFGRSEGSGNPCFVNFNRGGAPLCIDPFNKIEKENNSFGMVVGSPGSGKSVFLNNMIYSVMGVKRPRLFICEYGGSFDVTAEDLEMKGLSVNKMKFTNSNPPSLAPYATIDKLLDDPSIIETIDQNLLLADSEIDTGEVIDTNDVDTLGELELLTFLMITGSEEKEYESYNRADRALVCKALINTALRLRKKGIDKGMNKSYPCITSDVIESIRELANSTDSNISDKQRNNLMEMATSMEGFTTGLKGKLFNREGYAWPDTDVTLINLGALSAPGNKDMLAVAYTALMQHINNLAESTQFDVRDIVMLTDEAHLLTSNEMLSKLIVKQVKTARKLGTWPFYATQNLADFSGESEKLLSQIEWYYCLNIGESETQQIAKYKTLDNEKKKMMVSTRKIGGVYTEGVVISNKNEYLFRSVLPSLVLVMSASESSEKAERRLLTQEKGFSCDLEASYYMAEQIDIKRGITSSIQFKDVVTPEFLAKLNKKHTEKKEELEHA